MEYPSRIVVLSVKFETNSKSYVEATKLHWEEIAKAFKRLISFNIFPQCYTLRWLFVPCTIYQIYICSKSFVSSTFYFQISSKFDPYNLYEMERMKFYEKKHRVKLARLSVTYNPTSIIFNAS